MILTQSVMINTVPVSDANSDTQQYVSGVTAEVTMLWYHYHSCSYNDSLGKFCVHRVG